MPAQPAAPGAHGARLRRRLARRDRLRRVCRRRRRGQARPEGYLRALALLGGDVPAGEVLVLEDTEAGVASAKAAGMHVVALTRTLGPERLEHADALIEAIRPELMRSLLAEARTPMP